MAEDPRDHLDQFTQALVEKFVTELVINIGRLHSWDSDIALTQVDTLHKKALRRLTVIDIKHDTWLAKMSPAELPEEEALRVIRITIAALNDAFARIRRSIQEEDEERYRSSDEADGK